jgi:hypothetical protein
MATEITQMHLNVMSHVHCLSSYFSVMQNKNFDHNQHNTHTLLKQQPLCSSFSFHRKTNKFFYSLSINMTKLCNFNHYYFDLFHIQLPHNIYGICVCVCVRNRERVCMHMCMYISMCVYACIIYVLRMYYICIMYAMYVIYIIHSFIPLH